MKVVKVSIYLFLHFICIFARFFSTTVLIAMTHGGETRSSTMAEENMLEVAERAKERRLLRVSVRGHIDNQSFRQMGDMRDVVGATREKNPLGGARHPLC